MTDADKVINTQYFGSDPTDIRIRINPEIRIQIPDHFSVSFGPWREFALYQQSLVMHLSAQFFIFTTLNIHCSFTLSPHAKMYLFNKYLWTAFSPFGITGILSDLSCLYVYF